MTTEIIVHAHCADDKEVKIQVTNGPNVANDPEITLQDGESNSLYVYDEKTIIVEEVLKKIDEPEESDYDLAN